MLLPLFSINDQLLWEIINIRGKHYCMCKSYKQAEKKKGKRNNKKNLENLYGIFNENPTEINRQNIDVKETELNKCKGCTN